MDLNQSNKTYWKGLEELNHDEEFVKNSKNEFPEYIPVKEFNKDTFSLEQQGSHRRDFLKLLGFGVAAASLAACEAPVRKAIPYLNKPEEIDPSIPNWYASSFSDGVDYASIVVKTREGRPIKIEGNKLSGVSKGGVNARVQASVLSLYDTARLKGPKVGGQATTWGDLDKSITSKLKEASASGKEIYLVSNTVLSPSFKSAISEFTAKYPTAKLVQYDAVSSYGILAANEKSFGKKAIPSYDFSKAKTIVSFGADFLGTWIAPIEYAKQYAITRKVGKDKKTMSKHFQFETTLSLSGSNADFRFPVKPSQLGLVVATVYNKIASSLGGTTVSTAEVKDVKYLDEAVKALLSTKGSSLVVSSSNDPNVQILVNGINYLLGNYGNTLSLATISNLRQGDDGSIATVVDAAKAGTAGAVIFIHSNPVYDYAKGAELAAALKNVPLTVAISQTVDETSSLVQYLAPSHHYLESWSDAEPKAGYFSLGQPTISPLFKTRQKEESILTWAGNGSEYYSYLQEFWKKNLYSKQSKYLTFTEFWDNSLHAGVFEVPVVESEPSGFSADLTVVGGSISKYYKSASTGIEYTLYEKIGIGTGVGANNPWLQELPDPITKATWDNYVLISKKLADEKTIVTGDLVAVSLTKSTSVTLPVLVQPGQAYNTISIAVGYGRDKAGSVGNGVGKNVYPAVGTDGYLAYEGTVVDFKPTGEKYDIAQTQTHQTIMGRHNVQETVLTEYKKNPASGRVKVQVETSEGLKNASEVSLWKKANWEYKNHAWGLVIDLNSCIGCGACVIGCQAENNVPVVGKNEVLRSREMHWIRIDRYYQSDLEVEGRKPDGISELRSMEEPAANPRVVFQPMMCQHCNNAPCETVCPVLATTHSTEGLNQMAYNRCIGTRYCANNCPYKVRRFNWFSYYSNGQFKDINPIQNDLGKMVLNPDVTVRARGVMEKCSMCVQRIQAGKLKAKIESRRPIDGEIETACSQSCPTDAIVFGDMNDSESRISKLIADEEQYRLFYVLDEINTRPSVSYLTKVRNI